MPSLTIVDWLGHGGTPWRRIVVLVVICACSFAAGAWAASQSSHRRSTGVVLFGNRSIGKAPDTAPAGVADAYPFRVRRGGVATAIDVYVDNRNRAKWVSVALYTDARGRPGTRLGSGKWRSVKQRAWNRFSIARSQVRAGRRYWVAILGQGGAVVVRDRRGGWCARSSPRHTRLKSLHANWASGPRVNACALSAYVTGTVSKALRQPSPAPVSGAAPVRGAPSGPFSPPQSLTLPWVSGTPEVGQPLTVNVGTRSGPPTAFAYQWQRCTPTGGCVDISGATGSTYSPVAADVGAALDVAVTASDGGGSTEATSLATPVVGTGQSVRTFYIDYSSGSDSNSATSESSPWKLAPGMGGFSGSYSPQAGDRFVFKGGVTWPQSTLPLTVGASGTAGQPAYYGVDRSWYTGSSWSQPVFDSGNTNTTAFEFNSKNYVTLDGIHAINFAWSGDPGFNGAVVLNVEGSTNDTIENTTVSNWSHSGSCCDHAKIIVGHQSSNLMFLHNQFYQSLTAPSSQSMMAEYHGAGLFDHNTCFNMANCFLPDGSAIISNNVIHNLGNDYDSTTHLNAIEALGDSNTIYNNLIYNDPFGVMVIDWQAVGTNYVYNNVMWNDARYPDMIADCTWGGCQSGSSYVYNNICVDSNCLRIVNRSAQSGGASYGVVNLRNNQLIGSGAMYSPDSGTSVGTMTNTNNVTMSDSAASREGYTAASQFRPGGSKDTTVGAGSNLSGACSAVIALCATIDGVPRPPSGAWDAGAYSF